MGCLERSGYAPLSGIHVATGRLSPVATESHLGGDDSRSRSLLRYGAELRQWLDDVEHFRDELDDAIHEAEAAATRRRRPIEEAQPLGSGATCRPCGACASCSSCALQ